MSLAESVVAIVDSDGRIVGTAFAIDTQSVITCAHVITKHGEIPSHFVTIRCHGNNELFKTQISGVYLNEDVAILTTADRNSITLRALGFTSTSGSSNHLFHTFGYARISGYDGTHATGTILGILPKGELAMLQLRSSELAQGHSGAPVLDSVTGGVVGMVSEVYHPGRTGKHRDTSFAIPSETLLRLLGRMVLTVREEHGELVETDRVKLNRLRVLLIKHFSQEELKTICFELGLDFDDLAGDNRTGKVRELITYLYRRGRLYSLVELASKERSHLEWPDLS